MGKEEQKEKVINSHLVERSHDHSHCRRHPAESSAKNNNDENVMEVTTGKEGGGGIYTIAKRSLTRGEHIQSCPAISIAFDSASIRASRCGFCASRIFCDNDATNKDSLCTHCSMVAVCQSCKDSGAMSWHERSGECQALQSLALSYKKLFHDNDENEGTVEIESAYILTIRILRRRWYEQGDLEENHKNSERNDIIEETASPLPAVDWSLFQHLYSTDVSFGQDDATHSQYEAAVTALCNLIYEDFCNKEKYLKEKNYEVSNKNHDCKILKLENGRCEKTSSQTWINKTQFEDVLGKVMGCCHAITDVSLELGCQALGRALFLEHSFYNHSCVPNAFLSCHLEGKKSPKDKTEKLKSQQTSCALIARVHCIQDIQRGDSIQLSYIPTSGLGQKERQERLFRDYHFQCNCVACERTTCRDDEDEQNKGDLNGKIRSKQRERWDQALLVPDSSDLDVIRQVQYGCNESLLDYQKHKNQKRLAHATTKEPGEEYDDSLDHSIGMINMSKNGIKNQGIGSSHEVSIEARRLMAFAMSLSGNFEHAVVEHQQFLDAVESIKSMFDPVALSTSRLEFASDLLKVGDRSQCISQLSIAKNDASDALGCDHSYVLKIKDMIECMNSDRPNKKLKSS